VPGLLPIVSACRCAAARECRLGCTHDGGARHRFDFRPIRPAWLRDLLKRWLRWRICNQFALTQIRKDFTALARLAKHIPGLGVTPASLTRAALEHYLARLSTVVAHAKTRSGDISVVAAFLRPSTCVGGPRYRPTRSSTPTTTPATTPTPRHAHCPSRSWPN
jgi:hypothetical protein